MVLEILQFASIIIELIIAALGLIMVFKKKKKYGWWIFLTFAIYIIYDVANIGGWVINQDLLYALFFIASISALVFVIVIYREKKNKK
jgi:hypothetical protein